MPYLLFSGTGDYFFGRGSDLEYFTSINFLCIIRSNLLTIELVGDMANSDHVCCPEARFKFKGVAKMTTSAEEAKRAVKKCYPDLLKLLPINELVIRFYSRDLLPFNRKSELDSLNLPKEKVRYFLDEMVMPGLDIGYAGHFDEMVTMMKESDDILVRRLVKKLMQDETPDVSVPPATTDVSLIRTGIGQCSM